MNKRIGCIRHYGKVLTLLASATLLAPQSQAVVEAPRTGVQVHEQRPTTRLSPRLNPLLAPRAAGNLGRIDATARIENITLVGTDPAPQQSITTSVNSPKDSDADNSDKSKSKSDSKTSSSKTTTKETKAEQIKQGNAAIQKILSELPAAGQQMNKVVEKYWDRWTKGTGTLTIQRIGQLLADPKIKGEQAAILGALADYYYMGGTGQQSYSESEITQMGSDPSANKNSITVVADYKTALEQIRQDNSGGKYSLYGQHDPPTEGDNVQWNASDCYFLSAVNALIHHDPQLIVKMITQTGPDTFQVKFPGYPEPITVTLTDGAIAMFSHTNHGGCYLAVLGMAASKAMEKEGDPITKQPLNSSITATPIGPLCGTGSGWVEKNTFRLLTGKNYGEYQLDEFHNTELGTLISKALSDGQIVGVQSGKDSDYFGSHYLCILGYDRKTGMVTIKNPWANDMKYYPEFPAKQSFLFQGPPDGPGFQMVNGVFECSLADLKAYFGRITVQTGDVKQTSSSSSQSGGSTSTGSTSTSSTNGQPSGGYLTLNPKGLSAPQTNFMSGGPNTATVAGVSSNASIAGSASNANISRASGDANAPQGSTTNPNVSMATMSDAPGDEISKAVPAVDKATVDDSHNATMQQGSAFIAHEKPVSLRTANGTVSMEPRAIGFVVQLGNNLAIYNLGGGHDGKIAIDAGNGDTVDVPSGHALLLSQNGQASLEETNPLPSVALSSVVSKGVRNGQASYDGKFPLQSVLDSSPQFQQLTVSQRKQDQALVDKLLKTLAIKEQLGLEN